MRALAFTIVVLSGLLFKGGIASAEDHGGFKTVPILDGEGRTKYCVIQYAGKCYATLDDLQETLVREIRKNNPKAEAPKSVSIISYVNKKSVCTTGKEFDGVCFPKQEDLIEYLITSLNAPAKAPPKMKALVRLDDTQLPSREGDTSKLVVSLKSGLAPGDRGQFQEGKKVDEESVRRNENSAWLVTSKDKNERDKEGVWHERGFFHLQLRARSVFRETREVFAYNIVDDQGETVGWTQIYLPKGQVPKVSDLYEHLGSRITLYSE